MKSAPKAFIFDVFGTIVDWRTSVARVVEKAFANKEVTIDALAFADYWRGQYVPAMAVIRSGSRGYVALDQLHFENLTATLNHFELETVLSPSVRWVLNTAWEQLDPWPDVVSGLTALKAQSIIAPCSNGSIALMTRLAKYGGLPWDCILGADIAQNYKPELQVYHACCEALRLNPEEVMMVAAHNDDLEAAQQAGLKTGFIARPTEYGEHQCKDFEATGNWDSIVETIGELATLFEG